VNDVVDTAESGGDVSLNIHCVLGSYDKDTEAMLDHTDDALNDVAELSMAEIVAFLCTHRPSRS